MTPDELAGIERQIAMDAVRCDIERHALPTVCGGQKWWDTSAMLNVREHAPEIIDMMVLALRYADEIGLIQRHTFWPHLVRFKEPA